MSRTIPLQCFFSSIREAGIHPRPRRLEFYLRFLFDSVRLAGASVLDVGGGDGSLSFYAVCSGAREVVCLEPRADGFPPGAGPAFEGLAARLGGGGVRLEATTLQEYDPGSAMFDVILLHNSINHLDEEACISLLRDASARDRYLALFRKLAHLARRDATLLVTDCSRRNLYPLLGLKNPIRPTIEWHKHQTPEVWARLLAQAGFGRSRIRWRSPNHLRSAGRVLLGNRIAAFLLDAQFCLTMIRQ